MKKNLPCEKEHVDLRLPIEPYWQSMAEIAGEEPHYLRDLFRREYGYPAPVSFKVKNIKSEICSYYKISNECVKMNVKQKYYLDHKVLIKFGFEFYICKEDWCAEIIHEKFFMNYCLMRENNTIHETKRVAYNELTVGKNSFFFRSECRMTDQYLTVNTSFGRSNADVIHTAGAIEIPIWSATLGEIQHVPAD